MEQSLKNPLGYENINKLIRKFAMPSIFALLVSAIYNIVDQVYIGHYLGTTAMAATNVAFPLTPIATSLALLFGIGGASNYNLFSGEKKLKQANEVANASLGMMLYSGILLGIIVFILVTPMLYFFGSTKDIFAYALPYTQIIAVGLPFFVFATGAATLVRADGSPNYAMLSMLVGALFNIIFDPIFMVTFNMGIAGIALATTVGQILSALVLVYYLMFKKKHIQVDRSMFLPNHHYFGKIVSLGMAACFNQVAMTVAQIIMNNSLNYWGEQSIYGSDIPIAVVGIVSKLNIIFMAFAIGLAQGTQPIYGYNYGAKNYKRVEETLKKAIIIVTIISVTFFIIFQVFTREVISIFGEGSDQYYDFAIKFMRIFMFMTFANGLLPIAANFYTSIGKAVIGLWVSLTRQIVFLIPLILFLPRFMGIDGIVFAGPIADIMAFALTIFFILKEWKELRRLQKAQEAKSSDL